MPDAISCLEIRGHMYVQILKRTGVVLMAAGILDGTLTFVRLVAAGPWPAVFDGVAIVAGGLLLWGQPRAALWVRTLAVFALAAGVTLLVAVPFYQPLNLTLTEIRLDASGYTIKAASMAVALCLATWVARELGRQPVQDAIASSGIRKWEMRIPAQAGGGLVVLICLLLWLALHGQSAALAESLASQQLGPDYHYHLSWISSSGNSHGTSVRGVVTAWNDREIKTVLLHWETR
jgi:hypothetical protein